MDNDLNQIIGELVISNYLQYLPRRINHLMINFTGLSLFVDLTQFKLVTEFSSLIIEGPPRK